MARANYRNMREIVLPDGPFDDYIIVAEFPEIDYTLIYRNSKYEPWVAAWGFNREAEYWCQGHYFSNLLDATEYINQKRRVWMQLQIEKEESK